MEPKLCIFPNSREKESDTVEDRRDLIRNLKKNGRYYFRSLHSVGDIPLGSVALFAFKDQLHGEAIVRHTIKRKLVYRYGERYEGYITFEPTSVRLFRVPVSTRLIGCPYARSYHKLSWSEYPRIIKQAVEGGFE
jgi:hypothetical protein